MLYLRLIFSEKKTVRGLRHFDGGGLLVLKSKLFVGLDVFRLFVCLLISVLLESSEYQLRYEKQGTLTVTN